MEAFRRGIKWNEEGRQEARRIQAAGLKATRQNTGKKKFAEQLFKGRRGHTVQVDEEGKHARRQTPLRRRFSEGAPTACLERRIAGKKNAGAVGLHASSHKVTETNTQDRTLERVANTVYRRRG